MENQKPQLESVVKPVFQKDLKKTLFRIGGIFLIVMVGIVSGWLLAGRKGISFKDSTSTAPGAEVTQKEAGLKDEKTFRDTAEGILEEGGVNGEGTHHLLRPGGVSQTAYLTSTVIDLQSFVGKKVQVWGETISARKAGWLMDVGKIKVLE